MSTLPLAVYRINSTKPFDTVLAKPANMPQLRELVQEPPTQLETP